MEEAEDGMCGDDGSCALGGSTHGHTLHMRRMSKSSTILHGPDIGRVNREEGGGRREEGGGRRCLSEVELSLSFWESLSMPKTRT